MPGAVASAGLAAAGAANVWAGATGLAQALMSKGSGGGPVHHVATNKNWASTARGGPWSPQFEDMFKKAGMTLDDAENKVAIPGHGGPHPEAYHQEVFNRLDNATKGLSGSAYSTAFRAELDAIRTEAATAGTHLNDLLTQ